MTQKTVEDYMTKRSKLITFKPDDRIYLVIRKLIEKSISGAPVVNNDGELIGIISEKDCLKVLLEMVMHEMPGGIVERYMSHQVTTLEPHQSIIDAVEMFQKSNFRRFPVVQGSKLVGLISRRDVLMAIKDIGKLT